MINNDYEWPSDGNNYEVGVWTTYFCLVNTDTNKSVLNEDGSVALFTNPHVQYRDLCDVSNEDWDDLEHRDDVWVLPSRADAKAFWSAKASKSEGAA